MSAPPLGKFLASSEKPVRDKAVNSLKRYLSASKKSSTETLKVGNLDWDAKWTPDKRLQQLEMAKLWKGIYYCFWMSDKPLVQQALAEDLALLTLEVRPKSGDNTTGRIERFRAALSYLEGFWSTMTREWTQLDKFRVDKFLMLMRKFIHVGFLLLKREGWDAHAIEEYNAFLAGPTGPLRVKDPKQTPSIFYHICDIYMDELEATLVKPLAEVSTITSEDTESTVPVPLLIVPMLAVIADAPNKILFTRAMDNAFVPLLEETTVRMTQKGKRRKVNYVGDKNAHNALVCAWAAHEGLWTPPIKKQEEKSEDRPNSDSGSESGSENEKETTPLIEIPTEVKDKIGVKLLEIMFERGGRPETNDTNRRNIYRIYREWAGDS